MQHPDQHQHLDEGTIHAWLDGALSPDESTRVERHAAQCAPCAALVAEARGMIAGASRIVSALDGVPSGVIPIASRPKAAPKSLWTTLRLSPARAALAASLLLAAGTLLTVRHNTAFQMDSTVPVQTPQSATVRASDSSGRSNEAKPSAVAVQESVLAPARELARAEPRTEQPSGAGASRSAGVAGAANGVAAVGGTMARNSVSASTFPVTIPPPAASPAPVMPQVAAAAESKIAAKASAQRPPLDSAASVRDAAAAAGFAPRRAAMGTTQLQSVVVTGATLDKARPSLEGCYQVRGGDTTSWLTALPRQFQLEHIDSGFTRGVVRAVTPDGRIDSVVPAIVWRPVNERVANLQWTAGAQPHTLTLRLAGGGVLAEAASSGQGRGVNIVRTDCRP